MIIKKKIMPWLFVMVMLVSLFPVGVHAKAVSGYSELNSAIAAAATDGTETIIDISTDIIVTETINIPKGANIVLIGKGGKITTTVGRIFSATDSPVSLSFYDLDISGKDEASNYSASLGESDIFFVEGMGSSLNVYGSTKINTNGYIGAGEVGTNATLNVYGGEIKGQINCVGWDGNGFIYPAANISIEGKNYSAEVFAQVGYSFDSISVNNVTLYNETFEELTSESAKGTEYFIIDASGTPELTGSIAIIVDSGTPSDSPTITITASFGSPSVDTIEPTSEQPFTVPVILTSDSLLSGAELDLSCNAEVAKITDVTLASGLTANGNHSNAADGSSAKISFYGNEQSAKDGLTVAMVTMQPIAEGTSSLSITQGTAATSGTTLEYPVTVPESPVTVEVKSQDTISTSTYVSTSEGVVTLLKYTPGTAPAEGKVPAYESVPMMKGPDGSWLYLVKGEPDKTKISMTDGGVTSVAHPSKGDTVGTPADLNNTEGRVNIVDAQIAYDIATGQYTEIAPELTGTAVDLLHWLMADVNGDEKVDTLDARAIQAFIHTNEWFKDSAASA